MGDKHISSQFDAELNSISTHVLEMGAVALSGAARELLHDRRIIDTYLGMGRSAEAAAVA